MARTKGSLNRRSQVLLRKLEDENKFSIVNELLELYHYDKAIIVNLAARAAENMENGDSPTAGFTEAEIEMYNNANKNCQNVLVRLLSYCYPKLKATEVNAGTGDRIVFNVTGVPDIQQSYSPPPQPEDTVH